MGPETWAGPGAEITDGCEARRPLADFHGAGLRSGPDSSGAECGEGNRHSVAVWVRWLVGFEGSSRQDGTLHAAQAKPKVPENSRSGWASRFVEATHPLGPVSRGDFRRNTSPQNRLKTG